LSNYLSNGYIKNNSKKMAICSAISKYGINNFTLYILESYDPSFVSLKEARENFYRLRSCYPLRKRWLTGLKLP
jgi:hypothetical protein